MKRGTRRVVSFIVEGVLVAGFYFMMKGARGARKKVVNHIRYGKGVRRW